MEKPIIAKKASFHVQVKKGQKYFWCACGKSASQPFCDGSHKGSSFSPVAFTAENDEEIKFCGCKQTKNPPFCDGTHKSL